MANTIRVQDEYRKHPWSFIPGGVTVRLQKSDGTEMVYDKVKFVRGYLRKAFLQSDVLYATVDGKKIERNQV